MTPDELQKLREWSATEVMGWYITFTYDKKHWWYSAPNIFKEDNEYNRKYFGVWKSDDKSWLPDKPESGQIWLVVERMRELGFYLNLEGYRKEDGYVASFNTADKILIQASALNPCLAVLKAAKAALEGGE